MMLFSFNQGIDRFQVAEQLRHYHAHFIALANVLWEGARQYNPLARSALLVMISLIDYTEQHYKSFLNQSQPLAAFETFKLNNCLGTELHAIQILLLSKNISEPLIHQLIKAFRDLFKVSRPLAFNGADRAYVAVVLPQLTALARDERDKDWNRRLRLLLIKYNFNHMGIYQLLEKEQEKTVLSYRHHKQPSLVFYKPTLWLEQIQMIPEIAYDPSGKNLKTLLTNHLGILQKCLKEDVAIANKVKNPKLRHNISLDEMALGFHYNFQEKIYDYSTKKAAAELFCQNNSSIGTDEASVNSFLNIDKMDSGPAIKLYQRLNRIIKRLAADFDLRAN